MSQIDNLEDNSADSRLGNILRDTLLKRTGRDFKRNLDAAFVPIQEKENHDEVAERIFDNILKRKSEKLQAQQAPVAAAEPSDNPQQYGEQLDAILWPDADAGLCQNQGERFDEVPWPETSSPRNQTHGDFLDEVLWPSARSESEISLSHEQKLDAVLWPNTGTEPEISQSHEQKLDAILWPSASDEPESSQSHAPKLEAVLWPNVGNFIDFI